MILRRVISAFISCSGLSSSTPATQAAPDRWPPVSPSAIVPAQDFDKTVVPITELKLLGLGIEGEFGTGFYLDPTGWRGHAKSRRKNRSALPRYPHGCRRRDRERWTLRKSPEVHSQSRPGRLTITAFLRVPTICKLASELTSVLILKKPSVPFEASCSFTARSNGKPSPACLPSTTACPRTKPFIPARAAD